MTATLFDEQPEPIRPYWQDDAPSSGYSGSDTSRAAEPHRLNKQQQVWMAARRAGRHGVTWRDIADELSVHHGTASGALSILHQRGHLARLTEVRIGRKVYVLPSFVDGRAIEEAAGTEPRRDLAKRAFLAGRASAAIGHNNIDEFEKWWEAHGVS